MGVSRWLYICKLTENLNNIPPIKPTLKILVRAVCAQRKFRDNPGYFAMASKSIIVGSKTDVNANFIEGRPHQSKSSIDFENMLEKADFSLGKLLDCGGTKISGERGVSGHLLTFGKIPVDENSKGNSSNGDVFSKALEDFEITFEPETTGIDQDQDISTKNLQQMKEEIRLESKIGNGTWCDIDDSPDIKNDRFGVPMDGFAINDKMQRLLSSTNESTNGFKAQGKGDQMQISSQSPVNGLERMQINRTAMQKRSTLGSDVVVPINSATLYEELRRAIKEGDQLKKNNQQYELRNMELQGEVLEMSRMAAHYEAKSDRCSTREDELRNELNAAIKRATQYQKEVDMCKKKVGLIEGLFVDSEKRQVHVKKKLEEAECKIRILEEQNEELNVKLKENIVTPDGIQKAVSQTQVTNETEHGNEIQEQSDGDLREDEVEKSPTSDHICCSEYEEKEYRFLISALKQQLKEANTINKRYGTQVMHQVMTIERLKVENTKLQADIKDMKNNDRGRKGKAFLYLQQYRESQVHMQSIQSELKKERAEKDDLKLQCKWMKKEVDRLKSAPTSKSSEGTQNHSENSQEKMKVEDAKVIEGATNLVEERMKFARSVSKDSQAYGSQSQIADDEKVRGDASSANNALRNKNQYDTLKDQHEKLSIEMALTRNTVKKLESDNSELRQQISQLKAEIALGFEGWQKEESGGVIPGKYRRGNFEVVSKPANCQSERQKSRRTQSMSGFRATTRSYPTGNFERRDKAQSLIDLTKVSIDELDERRSSLKKHNSEGEKIHENYEDKQGMGNDKRPFAKSSNAARIDNHSKPEASNNSQFITRPVLGQNTHYTLRSTISFPHTDELSSFGNFKKAESTSRDYHVFKVPGALRASPAAKSLNSFIYSSHENTGEHDHQSKHRPINAQDYNYVAV